MSGLQVSRTGGTHLAFLVFTGLVAFFVSPCPPPSFPTSSSGRALFAFGLLAFSSAFDGPRFLTFEGGGADAATFEGGGADVATFLR